MEYFVGCVFNILNQYGFDLVVWEDGFVGNEEKFYLFNKFFNKNIYVNVWDNVWEFGVVNRLYKLVNVGYKVNLKCDNFIIK